MANYKTPPCAKHLALYATSKVQGFPACAYLVTSTLPAESANLPITSTSVSVLFIIRGTICTHNQLKPTQIHTSFGEFYS